jgi:hypothetical protein
MNLEKLLNWTLTPTILKKYTIDIVRFTEIWFMLMLMLMLIYCESKISFFR